MKPESRSAAILLATLAIGIVLGMVGQGLLIRERTRRVEDLRRPRGFADELEQVIEPRDDTQRQAIRAILEATGHRNEAIINGAHESLRAVLDSMRTRLAPILDDRQRERLDRMGRLPDPFHPPEGRPPGDRPPGSRPPEGPPPPGGLPQPPRDGQPPSQ